MEEKTAFHFSGFRFFLSVSLSVFLVLMLSADLCPPASDFDSEVFGAFLSAFHTYGLPANVFAVALSVGLYFWFQVFGYRVFRYSRSLTAFALLFGVLNTSGLYLFHCDALPSSPVSWCFFLLQSGGYATLFLLISRILLKIFEPKSS